MDRDPKQYATTQCVLDRVGPLPIPEAPERDGDWDLMGPVSVTAFKTDEGRRCIPLCLDVGARRLPVTPP